MLYVTITTLSNKTDAINHISHIGMEFTARDIYTCADYPGYCADTIPAYRSCCGKQTVKTVLPLNPLKAKVGRWKVAKVLMLIRSKQEAFVRFNMYSRTKALTRDMATKAKYSTAAMHSASVGSVRGGAGIFSGGWNI